MSKACLSLQKRQAICGFLDLILAPVPHRKHSSAKNDVWLLLDDLSSWITLMPVLMQLPNHTDTDSIRFLCLGKNRPWLDLVGWVRDHHVLIIDEDSIFSWIKSLYRASRKLRKLQSSQFIGLTPQPETSLLAKLSCASLQVLTNENSSQQSGTKYPHIPLKMASAAMRDTLNRDLSIPAGAEVILLDISPISISAQKRWPSHQWLALAKILYATPNVFLILAGSEEDRTVLLHFQSILRQEGMDAAVWSKLDQPAATCELLGLCQAQVTTRPPQAFLGEITQTLSATLSGTEEMQNLNHCKFIQLLQSSSSAAPGDDALPVSSPLYKHALAMNAYTAEDVAEKLLHWMQESRTSQP